MIKPMFLVALLGLAACAQFPEIDRAEASRARPGPAAPQLQPIEELLDESRLTAPQRSFPRAQSSGDALLAQAAALRLRAAALRRAKPAG